MPNLIVNFTHFRHSVHTEPEDLNHRLVEEEGET